MRPISPPTPQPPSPSPPPAPRPARPPPLTFASLDGTPFVRLPAVEAEITAALAEDPAAWLPRARASMAPETIVHLCRVLLTSNDRGRRRLGELLLILERRIARIVQKHAQGFDETTTEEIAAEVSQLVLERILAATPDPATEFLEVRFGVAVTRWTLTAVASRRVAYRPKPHEVASALRRDEEPRRFQVTIEHAGIDGEKVPDPEALLIAAEEAPRTQDPLFRALAAVRDPRHREAVVLHHLQGWPVLSRDPETQNLCARFGVSARQIHAWMAIAFAEMRESLGETS